MHGRALTLMALALAATPGWMPAQHRSHPIDSLVGVAVGAGGEFCLSIANPTLEGGAPIALVDSTRNGSILRARVTRPREASCSEGLASGDLTRYDLSLESDGRRPFALYFAVVGGTARLQIHGNRIVGRLDGMLPPDEFEVCASGEGLHFTIWNGPLARGERIWHFYYHAGYDQVSDCSEAEYS